jgi:DNA polymerase-3 subunit alpha
MAITDYKSMGGIVQFYKACKDKGVIPIIGYSDQEIFLAANKTQYKELLNAFSHGLIPKAVSIVGAPFLGLWNLVQTKSFSPVFCEDAYNVAKSYILDLQTKVDCIFLAQTDRTELCYEAQNELIEDLAKELNLPMVMIPEHYYNKPEDKEDHQLYIANKTKVKPREFENLEDRYKRFYLDGDYSVQENECPEYRGNERLVALIEPYDILSPPKLPKFSDNDDELFKEKLREGWKKLLSKVPDKKKHEEQIKREIAVLTDAGLSSYFLIVADLMMHCKENGWLTGCGRGSAIGCLSSYLMGITRIDPISYGLFFERFYNESRLVPKHVSFEEKPYK